MSSPLSIMNRNNGEYIMTQRTDAYYFTVEMKDGKPVGQGDIELRALRAYIKLSNKMFGDTRYVKLQGRGHRMGNRWYNQSLPLKYAERADVYVYTRR